MNYYIIGYGLAGGFGGIHQREVIKTNSEESADQWAFEEACQEYERYDGMYGLRSIYEIMEEEGLNEDDAGIAWKEERESWLCYEAEIFTKEIAQKYEDEGILENRYKDELK